MAAATSSGFPARPNAWVSFDRSRNCGKENGTVNPRNSPPNGINLHTLTAAYFASSRPPRFWSSVMVTPGLKLWQVDWPSKNGPGLVESLLHAVDANLLRGEFESDTAGELIDCRL